MEKVAVTAVCWIPRGRCKQHPARHELTEEDLKEGDKDSDDERSNSKLDNTGLEEFDMDTYDDDEKGLQLFQTPAEEFAQRHNKDPLIEGDPDSESEDEYHEVKPSDFVFLATSCEDDACTVEMYVYEEEDVNMYVHHDLMLGAYPLCMDWLSSIPGVDEGSFAGIGLFDHSIQIWDVDKLEAIQPDVVLGKPKKKKSKKQASGKSGHTGPVLCLHGSPFNRSCLVSGSADETVRVWDVAEKSCVHTYSHHTNKVQCARWHPTEQAVMLTAAFDGKLGLLDVRQPGQVALAPITGEAECAIWSQHSPSQCLVSGDNGDVCCFDVRKVIGGSKVSDAEKVLWTLSAHSVACTAVQDSLIPDLLITTSLDGTAKIWSTKGGGPKMMFSKDLQAGPLFVCQSNPEVPCLVNFGGKCPVVWDLSSESILADAFDFTIRK